MGAQTLVSLGFWSKRNETGVFLNVTGKASRLAPPYTFTARRDPFNINGLGVAANVLCVACRYETVSFPPCSAHVSCEYARFVTLENASVTRSDVSRKSVS